MGKDSPASGRNQSAKRIVVVSDLHCGSTVGLLPPDFQTIEGQSVRQNAVQRWLWECWSDFNRWAVRFQPFTLVVNGDLIEGNHHRTTQIISPDTADHVGAAVACLEPLSAKSKACYVVAGTETHTGTAEHAVARAIKAMPAGGGAWAFDRLTLKVGGCNVRFVHHITTTGRHWLRGSRLSIALAQAQIEASRVGHIPPDVLISSHCHLYDSYTDGRALAVTTPAWQTLTRYGYRVVPNAVPVVGGVVLEWRDGQRLPEVIARTYSPPDPGAIDV